jgi:lysophospholipase L1-like esterase
MKRKGCFLLLLVCLISCSDNSPKLKPLPKDGTVLALGNSLTAGKGVTANEAYPTVLAKLLKRRVINAGVSGDTTKEGLNRLPALLKRYHPQLVIVSLGGNDLLRRVPKEKIIQHLEAIISEIKTTKADIVLIAPPKPSLLLSAPEFYEKLGKKYHILVDTSLLPALLSTREYKSDSIHLNQKGYLKLAQGIDTLLKANGALETQ